MRLLRVGGYALPGVWAVSWQGWIAYPVLLYVALLLWHEFVTDNRDKDGDQ
jgi:hypothetical protein